MGTTFGHFDIAAVVDGEKDVGCLGEVGKGVFEGEGIGCLNEHKGHGGAEEDDLSIFVLSEVFTLQISDDA